MMTAENCAAMSATECNSTILRRDLSATRTFPPRERQRRKPRAMRLPDDEATARRSRGRRRDGERLPWAARDDCQDDQATRIADFRTEDICAISCRCRDQQHACGYAHRWRDRRPRKNSTIVPIPADAAGLTRRTHAHRLPDGGRSRRTERSLLFIGLHSSETESPQLG